MCRVRCATTTTTTAAAGAVTKIASSASNNTVVRSNGPGGSYNVIGVLQRRSLSGGLTRPTSAAAPSSLSANNPFRPGSRLWSSSSKKLQHQHRHQQQQQQRSTAGGPIQISLNINSAHDGGRTRPGTRRFGINTVVDLSSPNLPLPPRSSRTTSNDIVKEDLQQQQQQQQQQPTERSVISHLTSYSEYVSVTKYHSTYLNHLGGNYEYDMLKEEEEEIDDDDDDDQNNDVVQEEQKHEDEEGKVQQQQKQQDQQGTAVGSTSRISSSIHDFGDTDNGDGVAVDYGYDYDYDGYDSNSSSDSYSYSGSEYDGGTDVDLDDESVDSVNGGDGGDMMSIDNDDDGQRDEDNHDDETNERTGAAGNTSNGTDSSSSIPTFRHNGQNLPITQRAISTISVAFSHDKTVMASTHGDHTIKITCAKTGRLLQTLVGHPRTPWTVKFHPKSSNILASGCLGHQVRLWDWTAPEKERQCLSYIRLEFAIISLSFHPSGKCLAIANGTRLHFWGDLHNHIIDTSSDTRNDGNRSDTGNGNRNSNTSNGGDGITNGGTSTEDRRSLYGLHRTNTSSTSSSSSRQQQQQLQNPSQQQQQQRPQPRQVRALLTEVEQRHMLRCVHFPPNGTTLIVGGVNPSSSQHQSGSNNRGGISGGGMSFYLRMWDFDLDASAGRTPSSSSSSRHHHQKPRRAISNVRFFCCCCCCC